MPSSCKYCTEQLGRSTPTVVVGNTAALAKHNVTAPTSPDGEVYCRLRPSRGNAVARKSAKKAAVSSLDSSGCRRHVQRTGSIIAAIAAVGAVLGGLTGYWGTYK